MNPRQMQKMMKQMGIQQVEIPASRVVIEADGKNIVIDNPQVSRVNMMGQDTWQIVGPSREESLDTIPEISDDDVQTVVSQTSVSEDEARQASSRRKCDLDTTGSRARGRRSKVVTSPATCSRTYCTLDSRKKSCKYPTTTARARSCSKMRQLRPVVKERQELLLLCE